ncbi:hypothetical protein [Marinobacter sp. ELB17]|uniref:hypothetical protein n=1 Tax=Marinobacter sp. ELB17 TaxID=270374 RepID=UPI0000F36165|nr:hypothetical protein [Marinobacter sp. ELB17]EAZ97668.1 hypothetical protein MELB17_24087 [Marinobacter sp. ELB17]
MAHPSANYEYLAREQLKLGIDWSLESIAAAVPVGIEDQIDRLESDDELDDGARWRGLEVSGAPMAWLPKGLVLITMRKRDDGEIKTKACFIQVQ